jgi:hypothetical protein
LAIRRENRGGLAGKGICGDGAHAIHVRDFSSLPADQVVEIGRQIAIQARWSAGRHHIRPLDFRCPSLKQARERRSGAGSGEGS